MGKLTDEEFRDFLKTCRELAEGPFEEMQREVEVTNKFPQEFIDLARENNLYRYALPEQYGGWGFTEKEILQVQEEFSRGPGGMRMHLHYAADLNWRILDDYGCDELKAAYMDKFADKTIFTCFALTEQTGGTGADVHTTAVKDADGNYILNGEKWLISHTDVAQFAYVIAVTDPDKEGDERLSAFFVPMDAEGFELVDMPHMMGCRGAGHAGFKMTDVKLEPKYLLGKEGQGMEVAMHSLAISRVHIADSNLGMCQRMLEMSLARARDRVTFGKTINTRQAIKMKLADMACATHALRCMIIDFAEDYDRDPHNPYIAEKAAMCKLFSIEAVKKVSDEMLEIFGGDGYFEDSPYGPTERLYRDCRALWLEEGSPTIQRITIARELERHDGVVEYPALDWIAGTDLWAPIGSHPLTSKALRRKSQGLFMHGFSADRCSLSEAVLHAHGGLGVLPLPHDGALADDAAGAALQAAGVVEARRAVLADLVEGRGAYPHELLELLDVRILHKLDVGALLVHLVLVHGDQLVDVHGNRCDLAHSALTAFLTSLAVLKSPRFLIMGMMRRRRGSCGRPSTLNMALNTSAAMVG